MQWIERGGVMKPQKYFNNKKAQMPNRRMENRRDADKLVTSAYKVMNLLALSVLRDEFGFGTVRMNRFINRMHEKLECYSKGLVTPEELDQILKDEVGISVL